MPAESTFTFRMIFESLCTFVPDRPPEDGPQAFCVLLPHLRARNERDERASIDGRRLVLAEHFPLLKYDNRHDVDAPPRAFPSKAVVPLDRMRLVPGFEGGQEGLTFSQEEDASFTEYVADIRTITPDHGDVDEAAFRLGVGECSPKVASQIFVRSGRVEVVDLKSQVWRLPAVLDGPGHEGRLAQRVAFTVENVSRAWLTLSHLDVEGEAETIAFRGEPGEVVEVLIGTYCSDNPLGWDLNRPWDAEDDWDFVWHYEMLADHHRQAILERLRENIRRLPPRRPVPVHQIPPPPRDLEILPIPRPANPGISYPSGDNCIGLAAKSHPFVFPE